MRDFLFLTLAELSSFIEIPLEFSPTANSTGVCGSPLFKLPSFYYWSSLVP